MSTKYYRYQLFCPTENAYKYTWSASIPSVCPTNGAHSVIDQSPTYCYIGKTITQQNYNLGSYYHLFNTTSSALTAYLPKASLSNRTLIVLTRSSGSNNLIINTRDSASIDGIGAKIINDSNIYEFSSDGTNWTSRIVNTLTYTLSQFYDDRNTLTGSIPDLYIAISNIERNLSAISLQNNGDLLVGDGDNASVLPVGTNNQVLIADSTQDLGLRWGTLFDRQITSSVTTQTRTATAFADLTGMTLTTTLPSGTYNVLFVATGRISSTTGSNTGRVIININGSNVTESEGSCRTTLNNSIVASWTQANISSGTIIKVQWACSASSFTFTIDRCRLSIDGVLQ